MNLLRLLHNIICRLHAAVSTRYILATVGRTGGETLCGRMLLQRTSAYLHHINARRLAYVRGNV